MSIILNDDQNHAIKTMTEFTNGYDGQFFSIIGYAGVGKSSTIQHFLEHIPNKRVCFTAPTNKAVRVLKRMAIQRGLNVTCSTIFQLLGLKIEMKHDKEVIKSGGRSDLDKYDVVVIDEMSMISTELLSYIHRAVKYSDTKIIFMGDSCQLPPVGEEMSPTFAINNKVTLTKVMRQRDENPILGLCTDIRDCIENGGMPEFIAATNEAGNIGVHIMSGELFYNWMPSAFLDGKFDENYDRFRVIAWRNKTVDEYNKHIQAIRYPNLSTPFAIGEPVIFSSPLHQISTKTDFTMETGVVGGWDNVLCSTETEAIVQSIVKIDDFIFAPTPTQAEGGFNFRPFVIARYSITCKIIDGEEPVVTCVIGDKEALKEMLGFIADCIKSGRGSFAWFTFWMLKKYFADIRPAYAMTAHKCLPLTSKILTGKELKTIEQLSIGDSIVSGSGNIKTISDSVKTGLKPEFFIKTKSGRLFISSPEHRYLMPDSSYKEAKAIDVNDHLSIWRNKNEHEFSFDLNYWAYGFLVGDGCYSYKSNRVDVTIMGDSNVIPLVKEFLGKHGSTVYTYKKAGNKAVTLSAESKLLRDELLAIGLDRVTRTNKKICRLETRNQKANFIRGLMDSDGSCGNKNSCLRLVSISESLIDDVMMLLQEFGIIGRKSYRLPYKSNHNGAYTLSVYSDDCIKYLKQIGFSIDYKTDRLIQVCKKVKGKSSVNFIPESLNTKNIIKELLSKNMGKGKKGQGLYANKSKFIGSMLGHKNLSYFHLEMLVNHLQERGISPPDCLIKILDSFYFYDQVIETGYTGKEVEMMDIEVSDDHNFIYNGAVVHNSQGSTFENVFVDAKDILSNPNRDEALRCLYVAVSRASENVVVNV